MLRIDWNVQTKVFFSRYHHEAPPRRPTLKFKLDSTLVKLEHIAIFSSWIKKKDSSYYRKRNIPYKFNLLYRASRDGDSAASFHEKCDNNGATVNKHKKLIIVQNFVFYVNISIL